MALSNYTNIKAAVEKWLNRSGFADVTDNTEDFMIMAQRRFMRDVRIPSMEKVTTTTVSTVSFSIPTDYLELKSAMIIGDRNSLLARTEYTEIRQEVTAGRPNNIARAGASFYLGPPPDGSYDIELVYYADIPYIDSTNAVNWFSTFAPELILSASLVEAYFFLKDADRIAIWEHKFNQVTQSLANQKHSAEHSGVGLRVKPENGVNP